jgi:hypothetical protein
VGTSAYLGRALADGSGPGMPGWLGIELTEDWSQIKSIITAALVTYVGAVPGPVYEGSLFNGTPMVLH